MKKHVITVRYCYFYLTEEETETQKGSQLVQWHSSNKCIQFRCLCAYRYAKKIVTITRKKKFYWTFILDQTLCSSHYNSPIRWLTLVYCFTYGKPSKESWNKLFMSACLEGSRTRTQTQTSWTLMPMLITTTPYCQVENNDNARWNRLRFCWCRGKRTSKRSVSTRQVQRDKHLAN